ncbi:hypothetical protein [Streptomyces puniciscabiei]|uniref:hypothetical protein n=1 Tax=Streptomyces puniciscabiei TaxID=164348 RepID=UPI00332EF4A0
MPNEQDAPVRTPPRVLNPLWIISLFLGLSETTVGIAAALSNGWVQGALAAFAVTFPVLVSGAFFSILWKKPEVLYAPGDFPEHVPVSAYVDGMRHGSVANAELLKAVVRDTLEDVIPTTLSQTVTPQQVAQLVDQAVASAHEGIANRMLSVDLSAVHPDFRDFKTQFPLAEGATVSDFLDRLWAIMRDHVRPYTYGTHWVLIDRRSNHIFRDIGSTWAQDHFGQPDDDRPLKDIGFRVDMDLAVLPLRHGA